VSESLRKIALILPLTGTAAEYGQTVRAGVEAALSEVAERIRPTLEVIDSNLLYSDSTADKESVLNRLGKTDADVIIGPLLKSDLNAVFTASNAQTPIIALNTLPTTPASTRRVWQFGLRPEDEATSLVHCLKLQNRLNGICLSLHNEWSQRSQLAFKQALDQAGGHVLFSQNIDLDSTDLNKLLASALGLSQSAHRKEAIARITGLRLTSTARPSDQIQFICVSGSALFGVQIRQQCRYLYADSIPMLGFSDLNSDNPLTNADLGGVYFTDAPWLINATEEIKKRRQSFQNSRFQAFVNKRLFAMGLDAYRLAAAIVREAPDSEIAGVTGKLTITSSGLIARTSALAQFSDDGDVLGLDHLPSI